MNTYKLDRTQFELLTLHDADLSFNTHEDLTWKQRLELMLYLNSMAYGYAGQDPPRIDKTIFEVRKLSDG